MHATFRSPRDCHLYLESQPRTGVKANGKGAYAGPGVNTGRRGHGGPRGTHAPRPPSPFCLRAPRSGSNLPTRRVTTLTSLPLVPRESLTCLCTHPRLRKTTCGVFRERGQRLLMVISTLRGSIIRIDLRRRPVIKMKLHYFGHPPIPSVPRTLKTSWDIYHTEWKTFCVPA